MYGLLRSTRHAVVGGSFFFTIFLTAEQGSTDGDSGGYDKLLGLSNNELEELTRTFALDDDVANVFDREG